MKGGISWIAGLTMAAGLAGAASAQPASRSDASEKVVVYGTLSNADIGIDPAKIAGSLQSFGANEIAADRGATILDSLGSQAAGVSLSDSQGNGMFQDVRIHGFEASPLQGTAEGIAVYQNGVRLNEAFGDTVNWDAVPEAAIARMDVWSNNPVFGLNALGGAINLVMKNGFDWQGLEAQAQGGSYGHGMASLQYGIENGVFAFYAAAEGVTDGGWRLQSDSNLTRLYADAGWRFGSSEIHLVASGAQSALGVVGPTPIELAAQNSAAVYTYPQTTQNRIGSLALNGKSKLGDNWEVQTSAYLRALRQRHVDGNDGNFESCSTRSSFGGDVCLQDDAFGTPPGGKTTAYRNQFVLEGPAGQVFPFDDAIVYGTRDHSFTDSSTEGTTLQLTGNAPLLGLGNSLTIGGSLDHSAIAFRSGSALGRVFADLEVAPDPSVPGAGTIIHTLGNLGYAPVNLAATTNYYGLYAVDALDVTDALTLTAGFRLNAADISTRDRSGAAAELSGSHGYGHLNPLAGVTYKVSDTVSLFGGYSQANRAPTPLELDCASATQPCLLEGSLVADPPLKQVMVHTGEAGLRGQSGGLAWSASLFRTDSDNDIVALASVIQGRGFFTNVPLTRRQGVDLDAHYRTEAWSTYVSYSFLDATYQFTGALASPNNPSADADGNVAVTPGRHVPVNPSHNFRAGGELKPMPEITLGGEFVFTGSEYFNGDEANQNAKLPSRWVVNVRGAWRFAPGWELFGVVNNLFDRHDAAYGTYFQPDDTAALFATPLSDPRSVTLTQPISFQLGFSFAL
jgi:iron complex outermembrane receptor protein